MYNYNSVDGKIARIEELKKYINLIGEIPGDHLGYLDARGISQYLIDIKKDLEQQVAPYVCAKEGRKRYRYYYIEEGIVIQANSGAEAESEYYKLRKNPPAGDIKIKDLITGEIDIMRKIIINGVEV